MATSLADQLRRLKTPQTTLLIDSKKRASILFDPKEAALKDRETIYDIGYSGLKELIVLNPSFVQFEATLFDKNAREMQRAVESREVNKHLDETIKKFLVHLSPYLLLQSSHKCLEWLIRRFNINDYNKDELMMLIFPYHETKIFVKCIQVMHLNDPSDKWNWLHKIQAPGIPLSKQALLNRASSDQFFLSFICQSIVYAVSELETKSNTLQVYYAFYCTTVIGALEVAHINESHITNIYKAIRKGLKSDSVDFCAASMMIIGQLVGKTKLSEKFLESIVGKLLKISHAKLQSDVIILLVLIYRNQQEMIKTIPSKCLHDLVHSKWIPSTLAQIYNEGINILSFYLPLLSECLKAVQLKGDNWRPSKRFCDALLTECFFKTEDAEAVIRCTLDSFILSERSEESVITIESDNEDEDMSASGNNKQIKNWYTNLLKSLERKYSNTFDAVVKEIIRSQDPSISESKKRSLKTVLGFLFTIVCTDDNVNLFEKLYHHNAKYRTEAVKYLVKNLEKMCFSDDSKGLLKDSIAERISDESPIVVYEALQFNTLALIKIVGKEQLEKKLITVLEHTLAKPSIWEKTCPAVLKHLTSNHICTKDNSIEILVAVLPFLLQSFTFSIEFVQQILNSALAKNIPFIRTCKQKLGGNQVIEIVFRQISEEFESKRGLPSPANILQFIQSIPDNELTLTKAFYSMLLLGYSIGSKCSAETSLDILATIERFDRLLKAVFIPDNSQWMVNVAMGVYPLNLHVGCIKNIIDGTDFKEIKTNEINFAKPTPALYLLHKIFERLVAGMAGNRFKSQKYNLYDDGMDYLFETLLNKTETKIELFSNYFIVDILDAESSHAIKMEKNHQVYAINYFNTLLQENDGFAETKLHLPAFIRILSGLRSAHAEVRDVAFETLTATNKLVSKYSPLIAKLLNRKNEILMDENQLPLILFTILQEPTKELKALLDEFIEFIASPKNDESLVALLLKALTHVNNVTVLKSIANTALTILDSAAKQLVADGTKLTVLDTYKSAIVQNILSRFTQQTIKLVKQDERAWQTLLKSIENYGIILRINTKQVSVTSVVIELIDDDLFSELSAVHQKQVIRATVNSASYSENSDLVTLIGKFIKQVTINGKNCVDLLDEMANAILVEKMDIDEPAPNRRRRSGPISSEFTIVSPDILKTKAWKCGITWLELLQNKQKITNTHLLIPSLFAVLQKCLEFEDQSSVEYAKQLILSCILHSCVAISPDGKAKRNLLPDSVFKIELVVKCIRGTQNPQTHHHALQLLAHTAKMLPDQVLHNMMDIFTFMGSSVVRHDDAYSFQIIKNIIASIIPTLIRTNENKTEEQRNALVIPVLKVFSDILLDVPEHRRLPLYVKLIDTLNPNDYLWMFLAVLIESHIRHEDKDKGKSNESKKLAASKNELPRRIEIALALTKEFSSETIVITSTKMIQFLHKLPMNKPTGDSEKSSSEIVNLFDVNNCTNRQLRYYKYAFVQFISNLTSSPEFVNKIAQLTDEETKQMKPHYQNAIINILMFIPDVSKATEQKSESIHLTYWKALLHNCYDILENVISLLSPNMLLVVVQGLLSHKLPNVRRKVIELLINKLQYKTEFFAESDEDSLIELLAPLTNIIESIIDEKKQIQNASIAENIGIQQMSLMAVKLLSKQLAQNYPTKFKAILEMLIEILRKNEEVARILLATVVLCLAEVCSNLRAHSIAFLPNFMRMLLKILQKQVSASTLSNDNVLACLITAVQKIVGTLPLFLSPYLVDLIVRLSQIWDRVLEQSDKDPKRTAILTRLNNIWEKLSSTLQLRVLIPIIDQSYKQLVGEENPIGIGPLMKLLSQSFEQQTASNISSFMPEITSFFIVALQFRCDHTESDLQVVNALEDKTIHAFVALTLKLSEGSFRPLYCRIYDWSLNDELQKEDRAITFFRLSSEVAKSLKSLFVLFVSDFMATVAELLTNLNVDKLPEDEIQLKKSALLIESIVQTLYQVFLHDSQGFVNGSRFEMLLQPLVDQIENEIVLNTATIKEQLPSCLAQLGLAVNDDIQWKQLNYQILMKTRNNNSEIRIFALKICVELASKLGDDYMPLLPETVPFLSELLEDENQTVEKQCQRSVQELEKILGEPLQKYF